ncbi:hypothetical protein CAPTEDRAFT_205853 [Capitella teleta]|uniref:Uncharacterized protein n=1 Tax=Capitella teleta TaxID=283909 RepID=R7TY05_CAPTE|nr:hypothetical protein CAPTEDRAFT_205853 [Capitella teleta]|eukprot:ELT95830.1 hypothetical protein CAPTEDRAFT_205853 [Capitella teleta]
MEPQRLAEYHRKKFHAVELFLDEVDTIIEYILEGDGHHGSYKRLARITDGFGHRVSGSEALEDSIGEIKEVDESELIYLNYYRIMRLCVVRKETEPCVELNTRIYYRGIGVYICLNVWLLSEMGVEKFRDEIGEMRRYIFKNIFKSAALSKYQYVILSIERSSSSST